VVNTPDEVTKGRGGRVPDMGEVRVVTGLGTKRNSCQIQSRKVGWPRNF